MPWLIFYGSVAVAVTGVLTLCFARSLRRDHHRLLAIATAAALWPVMVVGLAQFGALHLLAACLNRHASAPPMQADTEREPAATPVDLVDSLARLARQIGATRPA